MKGKTNSILWCACACIAIVVPLLGCADLPVASDINSQTTNQTEDDITIETSTTFGADGDDLMIRVGNEFWTLDADTGTAIHHTDDSLPSPIAVRDFLAVWYQHQGLQPQSATQLITYSCFGTGWTTWPTPHTYEVRKVLYDDGLVIDFLDPWQRGATYVFQGQNGPTDFLAGHTRIRNMDGGFSIGDGFRAGWTHLMDASLGCIGTSDTCNQGQPSHDLVLLLGGYTSNATFNTTNCGADDPARTASSIRFFVDSL